MFLVVYWNNDGQHYKNGNLQCSTRRVESVFRPALTLPWELAQPLPRLRMNLDFMPSPSPEHPGLFIRDPYKYSDAMLVIPPPLIECLQCFDGHQSELDLRAALVRITGELDVGELQQNLIGTLSKAGFLEDAEMER